MFEISDSERSEIPSRIRNYLKDVERECLVKDQRIRELEEALATNGLTRAQVDICKDLTECVEEGTARIRELEAENERLQIQVGFYEDLGGPDFKARYRVQRDRAALNPKDQS